MSTLVGRCLGQYELVDLLGEGGVATVYRARDLADHNREANEVAIKVIKPGILPISDVAQQIKREALISSSLYHPNIVDVFGFGEDGERVYMVMRLLHGGNLAEQAQRKTLSLVAIGRVLNEVASALDY